MAGRHPLRYLPGMFLLILINVYTATAATRCYPNLGCYESLSLHALPQEPSHLRTEYRISCRGSVDDAVISATDTETVMKNKIEKSCLTVGKPIRVVTHGFRDSGTADWVTRLRDALLAKEDCTVVTVDWHHGAPFPYEQAVANSFLVARQEAALIRHLELVHGVPPLSVHLIGHSIGSHISGLAGAEVAPSRVARITGLDPAEPYFDTFSDSLRLDESDAIFVDVIHTDGERFTAYKGYGSMRRQGHVDFYPNGGRHQPGCGGSSLGSALVQGFATDSGQGIGCSHHRAIELFIRSVESEPGPGTTVSMVTADASSSMNGTTASSSNTHINDAGECSLWGIPNCPSWEAFEDGNCSTCPDTGCLPLGFQAESVPGVTGEVYLSTMTDYPFCGVDFMVTLQVSPGQSRAFGRLVLVLETKTPGPDFVIDFSRVNRHYHSLDTERHVVTTNATLSDVSALHVVFVKGSGLSALGTSDTLSVEKVDIVATGASGNRWTFCSPSPDLPSSTSEGSKQTLHVCGNS